MTRPICLLVFVALVSAPIACSSSGSSDGVPSGPDASVDATDVPRDGSSDGSDGATGDAGCCPRSPAPSGCMLLGGSGVCTQACDFFCSDNWRVERDAKGCELWRYDTRAPKPGENGSCFPALDAAVDAPADG